MDKIFYIILQMELVYHILNFLLFMIFGFTIIWALKKFQDYRICKKRKIWKRKKIKL